MEIKKLIKNNNKKLIIFFNGWSLDENIIKSLKSFDYDVIMFYDYNNLEISFDILNECNNYEEINIIAFSFGVWACGCVSDKFNNLKNVVAINGTLLPIDNKFGIPEKIFNLTLSNLSEKTYPRFFNNMFQTASDLSQFPSRTIRNQKEELIQIKKLSLELDCIKNVNFFTKVFIGTQDKIIPPKNQIHFWGQQKNLTIIKKESGHYIAFETWDEIING